MEMKDRLALAMEGPPRVRQAALARAVKVSQPTVNDWLSGRSKTIKGATLLAVAQYLNVNPSWLATGKGLRDLNVKQPSAELQGESQNETMDPVILSRALFWLDFEEGALGLLQPVRRAERLLELYQLIVADGGELSREHQDEIRGTANRGNADNGRGNTIFKRG